MRANWIKYIFIVFVIGLIIYSIIIINNNNQKKEEQIENNNINVESEILKDVTVSISKYDTINPIISNNKGVQEISKLIFEPLLTLTKEYKIENCLAKEWSKTSATAYIIKLKDDIKWSNGEKLSAEDVRYTIDRLKENKSTYSYNVQHVISVDVLDETTVKITLEKEVPFFEYNLTFPIVSKKYYEGEDFYTTTKVPIGTGMYKISNIQTNKITLDKNNSWWNISNENAKLEKIYVNLYNSSGEAYNSFKIGNLDLIQSNNMNLKDYIGTIGFYTKEYKGRAQDFISINCTDNILSKQEVRQAIAYSIDKDNIIASVYGGNYYVSNFPLDYGSYVYNENNALKYNISQAQKVLTENGWEYKNKIWQKKENYKTLKLNFTLVVNSSDENRIKVAEVLKTQIEQIGIKITIKKVTDSTYKKYLENKNYDLILTGTYNSLSPDLSLYFGESNLANFSNVEANTIISEVKNITDEKIIKEKMQKLEEIYNTQVPYISLYRNKEIVAYSLKLVGDVTPNFYKLFYNINNWYRQ